jgi:hypothetical protein
MVMFREKKMRAREEKYMVAQVRLFGAIQSHSSDTIHQSHDKSGHHETVNLLFHWSQQELVYRLVVIMHLKVRPIP